MSGAAGFAAGRAGRSRAACPHPYRIGAPAAHLRQRRLWLCGWGRGARRRAAMMRWAAAGRVSRSAARFADRPVLGTGDGFFVVRARFLRLVAEIERVESKWGRRAGTRLVKEAEAVLARLKPLLPRRQGRRCGEAMGLTPEVDAWDAED